jgi:signal peptidase I
MSLRPPSSSEPTEAPDDPASKQGAPNQGAAPPDGAVPVDPATPQPVLTTPTTGPAPAADPEAPASTNSKGAAPADGGFAAGPATKTRTPTAPSPATGPPDDGAKHRGRNKGPLSFLRELPALIIIAFLLALLIKSFLVQAFYIPSESMVPTLKIGDRVLVNKLAYKFNPPSRGDVIVFSDPHPGPVVHRNPISGFFHWVTEGLGFSAPPNEDFIKRVIGLPGDLVEERHGVIYVNGKRLVEPYLNTPGDDKTLGPYHVQPDHLFVLGDNRADSNDSRFSELGQIPMDKVIGKAFIKIWPPGHFGGLSDGTKFALAFL